MIYIYIYASQHLKINLKKKYISICLPKFETDDLSTNMSYLGFSTHGRDSQAQSPVIQVAHMIFFGKNRRFA